jgi:hypothetical protein
VEVLVELQNVTPDGHDYYKTLGVPRTASTGEIRRAYRKLARQCHPDLNPGDKLAEERFRNLQEAYHVLIDWEARQRYDQTAFKSERSPAERPGGTRGGTNEHSAASTGSFQNGEWMDGEAVSDAGERYIYVPPPEDKGAEVFQSLLVLLFTGNVLFLFYGFAHKIVDFSLPSRLGLEGYSGLVPLGMLFLLGCVFCRRRGSFLVGSLVINASFWCSLILYCRTAGILQWPEIKGMWPWVLPTHLAIMLGAKLRYGPMDWSRWGESGLRW